MSALGIFGEILGGRNNYTISERVQGERVKQDGRELVCLKLFLGFRGAAKAFLLTYYLHNN